MKIVRCKPILQIGHNKKIIRKFKSIKEATKKTNINGGNISQVCNGKRFSAGGYFWEFDGVVNGK
jgi:DNA endonuclease I-HmuI-like, NUMOD-like domain